MYQACKQANIRKDGIVYRPFKKKYTIKTYGGLQFIVVMKKSMAIALVHGSYNPMHCGLPQGRL